MEPAPQNLQTLSKRQLAHLGSLRLSRLRSKQDTHCYFERREGRKLLINFAQEDPMSESHQI